MSGNNTMFQPGNMYGMPSMPTMGQTSTRIMAPNMLPSMAQGGLPANLGMLLGYRTPGMPGMYQPYNPYMGYGYGGQPGYWNQMAYGMAGLPSYAIPRAGNYYTPPSTMMPSRMPSRSSTPSPQFSPRNMITDDAYWV